MDALGVAVILALVENRGGTVAEADEVLTLLRERWGGQPGPDTCHEMASVIDSTLEQIRL